MAQTPPVDYPYYDGSPVQITGARWWVVMAACIVAFAILILPISWGSIGGFVPAIAFAAIPLAALYYAAGHHWTAIFRRLRPRDFALMVGIAILNIVVTIVAGLVYSAVFSIDGNPAIESIDENGTVDRILFFVRTIPQLLGEELVTILPLLAILYLCYTRFHLSRRTALVIAWFATAVIFALLHLPTYNWNLLQVLAIIGLARLILTLAYLITKNILVSTGAHIINDWTLFAFALGGAGVAA